MKTNNSPDHNYKIKLSKALTDTRLSDSAFRVYSNLVLQSKMAISDEEISKAILELFDLGYISYKLEDIQ